jgi:hypothetical protein
MLDFYTVKRKEGIHSFVSIFAFSCRNLRVRSHCRGHMGYKQDDLPDVDILLFDTMFRTASVSPYS